MHVCGGGVCPCCNYRREKNRVRKRAEEKDEERETVSERKERGE